MPRILLTGASGFIATHVLEIALERGHDVRITVRSEEKAHNLLNAHKSSVDAGKLDYAIVPDIAQPGAFDEAVKSDKPFDAIIHTASPFHFNVTDIKKELLDPAVIGTTSVLKAAKANAPSVKKIVITSSFASIINPAIGNDTSKTYSEADWNPTTEEEALQNPSNGYRASKTFAEKAAWKFVEEEEPNFTIATVNPPLVFGPVKPYISSIKSINTSNERIVDLIQGKYKDGVPKTSVPLWVDVRNVAQAHVFAAEKSEADGKRFFVVAGQFENGEVADIIKRNFPEYAEQLPKEIDTTKGEWFKADNSRSRQVLGLEYIALEKTIVDTVKSLKEIGA